MFHRFRVFTQRSPRVVHPQRGRPATIEEPSGRSRVNRAQRHRWRGRDTVTRTTGSDGQQVLSASGRSVFLSRFTDPDGRPGLIISWETASSPRSLLDRCSERLTDDRVEVWITPQRGEPYRGKLADVVPRDDVASYLFNTPNWSLRVIPMARRRSRLDYIGYELPTSAQGMFRATAPPTLANSPLVKQVAEELLAAQAV